MEAVRPTPADELLARAKQAIREVEPDARVILFGSRARGDARRWSDWDLLVVVDGDAPFPRRARIWDRLTDLELELDDCPLLSALVVTRKEAEDLELGVVRNAVREGIEL